MSKLSPIILEVSFVFLDFVFLEIWLLICLFDRCGSTAEVDECGVCGGHGIDEATCDCYETLDKNC